MIPRIIHYCWLSDEPYPEDILQCMDTWREHLPDYEFILWDSKRFDVGICDYTQQAFDAGKYAFVSDYVRLYALLNYGGIYLDSDVELLRDFDPVLENNAFIGMESKDRVTAWLLGSTPGNELFAELLEHYADLQFLLPNGKVDMTPNPVPVTQKLIEHGLDLSRYKEIQELDSITVYPMDYFCPFNPYRGDGDCFTENTIANHHFNGAWRSGAARVKGDVIRGMGPRLRKLLGK